MILVGIVLFIVSIINPFAGLINYMAVLYMRPMEVMPYLHALPIAKIYAFATILGFIVHYSGKQKLFLNYKQDKLLLYFLGVIVLSFTVGWIPRCLEVFEQMLKNVIVYGLIVGMVKSEKRLKIFIWTLLIMSGIMAYGTFREFVAANIIYSSDLNVGRIAGFQSSYFGDPNDFGVMMNVVIPLAFLLGVYGRPRLLRPVSLFLMVLFVTGIVAARTRGGIITFGIVTLGLAYFGAKSPKVWQKALSIILIVLVIAGMAAYAPKIFKERASTILNYQNEATANERIENWKLGIKMFLKSPIIGVGAGNYKFRYHEIKGSPTAWMVSHSMYVDVLSELGMLGALCFFFLIYFTFTGYYKIYTLLRKYKGENSFLYVVNQGGILSLTAYCVGGIFLSILTYPMLYIILGINVATQNLAYAKIKKYEEQITTAKRKA